jgi:hypothetical protein
MVDLRLRVAVARDRRIAYPACQDSESDAATKMSTLSWNRKGFAAPGARAAFPSKPTFVSGMIALTYSAKIAENFPGEEPGARRMG